MNADIKEILPGEGLGDITFGIFREELQELIGAPSEIQKEQTPEGKVEHYHYDELELSVTFEEADNWELGTISTTSRLSTLEGENVIAMSRDNVLELIDELAEEDEAWESADVEDDNLITIEELNLNFWFDKGRLSEVQWFPVWEDDDEEDDD